MMFRFRRLESDEPSPSGLIWRKASGAFRAVAIAIATIVGASAPCSAAGLLIEAPSFSVGPGTTTGSFDLLLVNTNPAGGTSYQVASDQFVLSLSGPLGIMFTGVSIDTVAAPYIYVSSGTLQPGGPPLSTDSFPNTTFTGADIEFALPGYRTLNPGDTFGLAHVSYALSSNSFGTDTITIAPSPMSLLTDVAGNPIEFGIVNGSITAVPEPWALTQASTAVLVGLGLLWRRRRKHRCKSM
jgi:hypothetical protein